MDNPVHRFIDIAHQELFQCDPNLRPMLQIITNSNPRRIFDECFTEATKEQYRKGEIYREDLQEKLAKLGMHEAFEHHQDTEKALHWFTVAAFLMLQQNELGLEVEIPDTLFAISESKDQKSLLSFFDFGEMKIRQFISPDSNPRSKLREIIPSFLGMLCISDEFIAAFCANTDGEMNSKSEGEYLICGIPGFENSSIGISTKKEKFLLIDKG